MEGPLILVLVKWFLKLIGYICSLVALPITFYSIVVNKILKFDCEHNSGAHFLIFIPRILLVLPFFFSFPLLSYLYGYLVSKALEDHARYVPFVISIGFLAAIVIGYSFTRSLSLFKDSISKMKIVGEESYFKGVAESLLDLGATVAFVLSIVTVIRIPFMIISMAYRSSFDSSKSSIRTNLYRHMFLIIFDILCLPAFLFVLITILRAPSLFKKIGRDYSTVWRKCFNIKLRFVILLNALIAIMEIFTMIFTIIFLLAPWRIKVAIDKFQREVKQGEKFVKLFQQECHAIVDLGVILLSTPLIISFYRLPYAVKKILFSTNNTTASSRRVEALFQSLFVFVDLFIMLFSVFIIVTLYRLPRTIRKVYARPHRYYEEIAKQFLKILIDIPFLFMGLIVTITLWRLPFMITQCWREPSKRGRRGIIKRHFLWLFVDIIDLPFVLSSFIIMLTVWRAYAFVVGFVVQDTRKKQRVFVIKQIFYWLMDIPTFIGLLLITLTVYRLPKTFRLLKSYFSYTTYGVDEIATSKPSTNTTTVNTINFDDEVIPPNVYNDDDEDNPAPISNIQTIQKVSNNGAGSSGSGSGSSGKLQDEIKFTSWRKAVLSQLYLLLIDIPFPVLLLLTLWRLPILIGRLKEIQDPIRKYSLRRLLILRYVLLTLLDILCLLPTLFILMTVWRIPSFISMVKQYQRGDNEHRKLGLLFWNTLVDVPFVIMGLITLPVLWRGPFLIKAIFVTRECKTDKQARIMAAKYLGFTLLDIVIALELIFILCTVWRIKSFIKIFKDELALSDTKTHKKRFRHSLCLLMSSTVVSIIIFVDVFKATQILIICLFIKQVKPLYQAIQDKKQELGDKFELKEILDIINYYFIQTLADIPHVFLIPFKLLAFVFVPIHLYLKKRTGYIDVKGGNNYGEVDYSRVQQHSTMSFINYPLLWLHELSINCLNYYGMDKFFVINIFGIGLILINELSLIVVMVNCVFMFAVTLGSPLWNSTREKYGWTALGKAQGSMVVLEYITVVLQALLFPVFILIQIAMLLLPTLLALGLYPKLNFIDYWQHFFTERSFWREASQFSTGIWVLQAFWFFVVLVSWQVTYKVAKKFIPLFSPWKSYYWLVKKVFHGRIWYMYTWLLIKGTRICYRLRRACLLGELLMFPLFIVWSCWSFIIPIVTKIYLIFIASGIISLGLIVIAYRIVKKNWTDQVEGEDGQVKNMVTLCNLQSVSFETPESGGLVFKFTALKTSQGSSIQIRDARLSLNGEKLWSAIEKIVGKTKVRAALMIVGYPISLVPMFLNIEEINNPAEKGYGQPFTFSLKIGIEGSKFLMKKKLVTRLLNQIREIDDTPFEINIEFGKKNFGWEKHGTILSFNTSVTTLFDNSIGTINNFNQQDLDNGPSNVIPYGGNGKRLGSGIGKVDGITEDMNSPEFIRQQEELFKQSELYKKTQRVQLEVLGANSNKNGKKRLSNPPSPSSSSSSSLPDNATKNHLKDSIGEYKFDHNNDDDEVDQLYQNDDNDEDDIIDPEQIEIETKVQLDSMTEQLKERQTNLLQQQPSRIQQQANLPPLPTPPPQLNLISDMNNYISDDQDNEEFYKSLDKSNNV